MAKNDVPSENADISVSVMSREYLVKNKPVRVKGWARDWPALKKWSDKNYFLKEIPTV